MAFIDEYENGVRDLARRQSELKHRMLDVRDKPADPLRLAEVRDRYNAAYQSLGARGAPQPITRESAYTYRRRLATGLQPHSATWRDTNLFNLGRDVLDAAEPQIMADVRTAVADHSRGNPDGSLREIKKTDGGHSVVEFAGSPLSWMAAFMGPAKSVRRFQRPDGTPLRVQRATIWRDK